MTTASAYQICTRCVMDTTDPDIQFNDAGVCSHCQSFDTRFRSTLEKAQRGELIPVLDQVVEQMKQDGKGRAYDCVMGLSGGVDSSYVAIIAKKYNLRILAVHCDSGWNSELAVNNIENIVRRLNLDLVTEVIDWEEMRDLQLSFFKAGLANCDIPQDHAFLAVLYKAAAKHRVRYILSGSNLSTESILPWAWGYNAADLTHLKAVHKRFGTHRLKRYPTLSIFKRYFLYPFVYRIGLVRVLNHVPYIKADAKKRITDELGWRDYGGKHYESIFTKFFQSYYLPVKFGFDKRRAHISSLIVSHQMTRDAALEELKKLPYDESTITSDKEFIAKKLGISLVELDRILNEPPHSYKDYPNAEWLFNLKDKLIKLVKFKRPI